MVADVPDRDLRPPGASPLSQGRLTETRFIQEAWAGVKWQCTRGFAASQALTAWCLWAA